MFGLSGRELRFAFVISCSHFSQHFLMRLIPPLIPLLAVALSYPLWQLGLLVSIYTFGGGLVQAPVGILADRYDRRFILPPGLSIAGLSYVLFASAPELDGVVPSIPVFGYVFEGGFVVMSLAMVGVGMGVAVVHPTAYPLITANVRAENKGKVLGSFGSFGKLGGAVAPTCIGILILVLDWEQIVLLLGVLYVVIGVLFYVVMRDGAIETTPTVTDIDASTTGEESEHVADADASGNDTGSAGDGVHAKTLQRDATTEGDRRTYLYPLAAIYAFFITKMFASNGLNTFVPVFIVGVYAYRLEVGTLSLESESVANFYFAALLFSAAVSQLLLGGVTDRYDARGVILGCLAFATAGLFVLALVDLPPGALLVVLVIIGAGVWGLNPARDTLISNIAPPDREGRTFGYIWTAVQLTSSVIPVLVGYTIEQVGFRTGFLILSSGTILAFLSIALLYLDRVYVPNTRDRANPVADPSD